MLRRGEEEDMPYSSDYDQVRFFEVFERIIDGVWDVEQDNILGGRPGKRLWNR